MYKAGDVANGHVLNPAGQWMPHPIDFRDERTRVAPAVKAATAKRRPTLRESAQRWYAIFWLLAVLSAIGVWIALGAGTDRLPWGSAAALSPQASRGCPSLPSSTSSARSSESSVGSPAMHSEQPPTMVLIADVHVVTDVHLGGVAPSATATVRARAQQR